MPNATHTPIALLITGVCGTGKSTIGKALALHLRVIFLDADDFHPLVNRQKMANGSPLDDADRAPWLAAIAKTISQPIPFILACSALKEAYRAQLRLACPTLKIIHLTAPREVLHARLVARTSHFMPANMLNSQLDTLETPSGAPIIDTTQCIQISVQQILDLLCL